MSLYATVSRATARRRREAGDRPSMGATGISGIRGDFAGAGEAAERARDG